ncbi:MAG: hypothetical protein JSR44_11895 [Spirochaetes bacterium]|nr:hypothetical protein [Spirochaetota bacterium]
MKFELTMSFFLRGILIFIVTVFALALVLIVFQLYVRAHETGSNPFFTISNYMRLLVFCYENTGLIIFGATCIYLWTILLNNNLFAFFSGFYAPRFLYGVTGAIIAVGIVFFFAFTGLRLQGRSIDNDSLNLIKTHSTKNDQVYFFTDRCFIKINDEYFFSAGNVYISPQNLFPLIFEDLLIADKTLSNQNTFPMVIFEQTQAFSLRRNLSPSHTAIAIERRDIPNGLRIGNVLESRFRDCAELYRGLRFLKISNGWQCVRNLKAQTLQLVDKCYLVSPLF